MFDQKGIFKRVDAMIMQLILIALFATSFLDLILLRTNFLSSV